MADFRGQRRRTILIFLILASVTLITLDSRGGDGGVGGTVRNAAHDVFAPVQDGVDNILAPVEDWWDGVTEAGDIKAENRQLRRDLQAARGRLVRAEAAIRQNMILKRLNELVFIDDIPAVTAQIILGSPGNFQNTVGLDKGSSDGIEVDMPVVSGRGLMGRIAQVSERRSTVLLVTDADSGVSVRSARTGATGVLNGRPDNELQSLDFVKADAAIRRGDVLLTAGSPNGPFPAGIPVGEVASVRKRPGDLLATISVRLFADASRTEFVKVLQYPEVPAK